MSELARRNRRVAFAATTAIASMVALTAASVPLYDLFCRVTGYGGTTQVAVASDAGAVVDDVRIEVSFNADIATNLPWKFEPVQRKLVVSPGESHLALYRATNVSDRPIVGHAVYNVTPFKVGYYFNKVHCFCFEQQRLDPGESIDMPVSFFVDPAMLDDIDAEMVRQITLSYTFFIDEEATNALLDETS